MDSKLKYKVFNEKPEKMRVRLKNAKILVVDDDILESKKMEAVLQSAGFNNINVANTCRDAFEYTDSTNPDIVIIDLQMTKFCAVDYCKNIKLDEEFKDIPILAKVTHSDKEKKVKAFEYGATDFIIKPVDHEELIARIIIHLEKSFLLKDLNDYSNRIKSELRDAANVLDALLPKKKDLQAIKNNKKIDIHPYFVSWSEVGGDMWGVIDLKENEIGIYIADFTGHGVGAALNTLRLHTMMFSEKRYQGDPGKYLTRINKGLQAFLPTENFATMFYGIINTKEQTLSYACAATPDPLVYSRLTGRISVIDGSGLPLGISKKVVYETKKIKFRKHDKILLYSDALVESKDKNGNFLSLNDLTDNIHESVKKYRNNNQKILSQLLENFYDNYRDDLKDDLTIVLIGAA